MKIYSLVRVLFLTFSMTGVFLLFPALAQNPSAPVLTAKNEEIKRLMDAGSAAYRRYDYDGAAKAFADALNIAREIKNEKREFQLLSNLGAVYQQQGEIEKAIECHRKSIALCEQQGHPEDAAFSWMGLANDYDLIGRYEDEIAADERAIVLLEKQKDFVSLTMTLNNVGVAYQKMGLLDKANDVLLQALAIHEREKTSPAVKATTLFTLCETLCRKGEYDTAFVRGTQALALFEAAGDTVEAASVLVELGVIYALLGRYPQARENIRKALTVLERTPAASGYYAALINYGSILVEQQEYPAAQAAYEKALAVNKQFGRRIHTEDVLYNLALVHSKMKNGLNNRLYLTLSLEQARKNNNIPILGFCYNSLGVNSYEEEDYIAAVGFLRQAIAFRRRQGDPLDLARSLANLGMVLHRQGRWQEAVRFFEEAIALLRKTPIRFGDAGEVGQTQSILPNTFAAGYAALLLEMKRPVQALLQIENGRTWGLARQAAQNRVQLTRFLTPAEAGELQTRTVEYDRAAGLQRAAAARALPADPPARRNVVTQIVETRARQTEAERRLRLTRDALLLRYPEYGQLQGQKQAVFSEIAALSRRFPRTTYLVFAGVENSNTLRFALQNGRLQAASLSATSQKMEKLVGDWRNALLNRLPDEPAHARRLYTALFERFTFPAARKQTAPDSLVFVVDGPLLDVPFAALRDKQGRRLIERFAISSAFSLGSLTWKKNLSPKTGTASLLCIADPLRQETADARLTTLRGGFAALPAARQEAEALIRLYPGGLLTGAEPTKTRVMREMPSSRLLHFATHSVADSRNGLRSFLVLAEDGAESGFLEAREIAGMQLKAELAVLSACETGQGEKQGREGLVGLAWAFRAAGVPAIVASQWKVDDAATKDLMVAFYKSLKTGKKKDAALREAMLLVMRGSNPKSKTPNPQSPALWAAFQIIGETTPLASQPGTK